MTKMPGRKVFGRHVPFYAGIGAGALLGLPALWLKADFAVDIAAICSNELTPFRQSKYVAGETGTGTRFPAPPATGRVSRKFTIRSICE